MANRRDIRLADHDLIAAAQILSRIALPHRQQVGEELLCQWFWARRRHRGEPVPGLSFQLKKPSRLEPQIRQFKHYVLKGFRAGTWFEWRMMSAPRRPAFMRGQVTMRSLAKRQLPIDRRQDEEEGRVIGQLWSPRKPIAHLAIAAANAIAVEHRDRGVDGFDLEMTLFNPVWVTRAIDEAESRARAAVLSGAFRPDELYRFHRDSF